MNPELQIDIDGERIRMNGHWMTHGELENEIKKRVNAGNYHVANLSLALQLLEENLSTVETIELRMPQEVFQAFNRLGKQRGVPSTSLMRLAMVEYLARNAPQKGPG